MAQTESTPVRHGTMAIEKFDDLIGTWAPAVSDRNGERQLFHFSPLGHFVMEWGSEGRPQVRICDLSLTRRGFAFTNRQDGTATELQASLALEGQRLVLVPPHGERTILRRVVEEMEAQDCAFFVKREG